MLKIDGVEIPAHISYSSLTTWLDCGWKYFLSRVKQEPEAPAWWFYGGTTVHMATESYDRMTLD